jgi:hypothetical protein
MKCLLNNRKMLIGPLAILFLSPIILGYKNIAAFKTNSKLSSHNDEDQIIQVGLTLANGYTGETSIVITADSIHFKSNPYKVKQDTVTSKELWKEINDISNIDEISKIPNGKTHQDLDGTDTICYIKTRLKKEYSFINGYGERFERQNKLVSLLMTELFRSLFKSLK